MHLCRNAWQRLAPLTQRGAAALLRTASARQMSSSVPGSSGEALPYYLLVGVALAGGGFYAYRTLHRDKQRFNERHEYINTQLKPAFEDYESKIEEPENIESVGETLEETSPVLEATSDNITAELASAAEDWSELTTRKPEEAEAEAESAPAAQESEEAVESEQSSASS